MTLNSYIDNQSLFTDSKSILKKLLWLRISMLQVALVMLGLYFLLVDKQLPYFAMLATIVGSVFYSLVVFVRLKPEKQIFEWEVFFNILFDAAILVILVSMSGRASNPFIYYLLVLVAINATIFSRLICWVFTATAIVAYTALLYFDLDGHMHHMFDDFQLHLVGMWINFVGSAILVAAFVSFLAKMLRDQQRHLAAIREENLKNEQLIGIATLSASTVHALGTPLSTMAVILGESLLEKNALEEQDTKMLLGEVERCKKTLSKLSLLANNEAQEHNRISLCDLLSDLKEHYDITVPRIMPEFEIKDESKSVYFYSGALLFHAIINLIDNAIQAAKTRVYVTGSKVTEQNEKNWVALEIVDDGDGITNEVASNWGKPMMSDVEQGLGIGVFLANSTIEKYGGRLDYKNNIDDSITQIIVKLPCAK